MLVRGEVAVLRIEAREGRVIVRETRALAARGALACAPVVLEPPLDEQRIRRSLVQ